MKTPTLTHSDGRVFEVNHEIRKPNDPNKEFEFITTLKTNEPPKEVWVNYYNDDEGCGRAHPSRSVAENHRCKDSTTHRYVLADEEKKPEPIVTWGVVYMPTMEIRSTHKSLQDATECISYTNPRKDYRIVKLVGEVE